MNPTKPQSYLADRKNFLSALSAFVGNWFFFKKLKFWGAVILAFLLFSFSAVHAQDTLRIANDSLQQTRLNNEVGQAQDTLIQSADTLAQTQKQQTKPFISLDSLQNIHSPRKAAFYSAVLPGLGQIYNHQYIKVPLMLGGLGVATGIFIFNFNHYITYRNAYRLRLNGHPTGDPRVDIYSQDDLRYLRDGYRQYVDYSVLGFAAVYLYNILDAVVFAYLYHFDISNDLSKLKFGPILPKNGGYAGIGFTYTF